MVWERVFGKFHEHEYAVTAGLAHTLVDEQLSLGVELKVEAVDRGGTRFDFSELELLGGPSLQWRPVPALHVDLVVLFQ